MSDDTDNSANTSFLKTSAINIVFIFFVAGAILFAAYTGQMKEITDASFESAKSAVTLAIGLIGIMALWLGLVRVLEAGGLMYSLARLLRPLMVRLFPDVPEDHPAMGTMILNISANMLGLGNAATPFGIKAMVELNRLNPLPGTATNAMCLFLAINTSSIALFPLGVIGVRAAAGSSNPAAVWLPTLIATLASTAVGVIVALFLSGRDYKYQLEIDSAKTDPKVKRPEDSEDTKTSTNDTDYSHLLSSPSLHSRVAAWLLIVLFIGAIVYRCLVEPSLGAVFNLDFFSFWLMPALMFLIIAFGVSRGVKIYEAVTEGAKQGFEIAVRIIPFLVAILVAIGMFRASGAMELIAQLLNPFTERIFMPAEALPMALIRPLSGSGAFGIMSELINQGPDSYSAFVASTMMGSTETTFYVLAVYFGAVGIVRIRHALVAALLADTTGIIVSCICARFFWTA